MSKEEKQPQPSGEAIMDTPGPEPHGFVPMKAPKRIPIPPALGLELQRLFSAYHSTLRGALLCHPDIIEGKTYEPSADFKFLIEQ